jgi:hypothetical protein
MIQKFTKHLMVVALTVMLMTVNLFGFAKDGMKDIELDPDKTVNVGNQMKTFPTIASNEVTMHFFFENDGMVELDVYDSQGRTVHHDQGFVTKARTHETKWDVNQAENGTYFVKLTQANGASLISKVIVRH